jgi:hypothetical protein
MAAIAEPVTATVSRVRRHELDWLRTIIVLGLIPAHAAVLFSASSTIALKNAQTSMLAERLVGYATAWAMPLLFLISGAGAWYALGARTPGRYVQERLTRLFLPFAIATLVLIPVQDYVVAAANPQLLASADIPIANPHVLDSYFQFFPAYLQAYAFFMTHFSLALVPIFWAHLWFLPRLLVVSIITLPLLVAMRRERGRELLGRLAWLYDRPGGIFLLGIPLVLSNLIFSPGWLDNLTVHWPIYDEWNGFILYLLFFLVGYVIYSDARLLDQVVRYGDLALGFGTALWGIAQFIPPPTFTGPPSADLVPLVFFPFRSMIAWLLSLGVLSVGCRYLRVANRVGGYVHDAALPIYVLHMPVIVVIGVTVLSWHASILVKFLAIVVGTSLTLYVLYDRLIRRVPTLRLLFGLKPQIPAPRTTLLEAAQVGPQS